MKEILLNNGWFYVGLCGSCANVRKERWHHNSHNNLEVKLATTRQTFELFRDGRKIKAGNISIFNQTLQEI